MRLFLAVAGNMGAGKSTLTKILAERLGGKAFFEPVAENPYLADFYKDMNRWAFHSQLFFLSKRLQDHSKLLEQKDGILIQDRSLYENAEVFAKNLYERGAITERDWNIYREIYETAVKLLAPPDLIIYLEASVPALLNRINSRGRDFEQKIDPSYLADLNRLYNDWANNFSLAPVLYIPTDDLNYIDHEDKREYIVELISRKLGGLPTSIWQK
jgi:hypothetical protein